MLYFFCYKTVTPGKSTHTHPHTHKKRKKIYPSILMNTRVNIQAPILNQLWAAEVVVVLLRKAIYAIWVALHEPPLDCKIP